MNTEQLSKLRGFVIEGGIDYDENSHCEIHFYNEDTDEEYFVEIYCKNFSDAPDGDEMNLPLEEICETRLEETEVELQKFTDGEGNEIELDSEAFKMLNDIINERC